MSVIRVDNFGPSAGGTTYSARGIAKAWAYYDGTGTASVVDSLNVSSLTDGGTGDHTINYTNAFDAANYSAPANTLDSSAGTFVGIAWSGKTASSTRFTVSAITSTSVARLDRLSDVAIHGDLA